MLFAPQMARLIAAPKEAARRGSAPVRRQRVTIAALPRLGALLPQPRPSRRGGNRTGTSAVERAS